MSQCIRSSIRVALKLFTLTTTLFLLNACSEKPETSSWKPGDLVSLSIEEKTIEVELALSQSSQMKGLMHRNSMPENHGMLFVFPEATNRSFWMKNTIIPLDLAYIDSMGTILEIHPLYPLNTNSVKSRSTKIQYVLEMNQGWFKSNNLRPGAKINLSSVLPIMRDHNIPYNEMLNPN